MCQHKPHVFYNNQNILSETSELSSINDDTNTENIFHNYFINTKFQTP
jgi:hypothetical protein